MLRLNKYLNFKGWRFFLLPIFFIIALLLLLFLLDLFFPLPEERLFREESTLMYFSNGDIARIFLTEDEKIRIGTDIMDMPAMVRNAFISAEDRYFYRHPGINPFSLAKALYNNIISRRIVSGASTITMQTARMMEPKRRTVLNKIVEAFRSFQIEFRYSKEEILEIYFNLLPFGGNLEGIETASLLYFSKSAKDLNPGEIAILTTIPRSPNIHNPATGNLERIKTARNRALKLMLKNGVINQRLFEIAIETPVPSKKAGIPFNIPHYSDYLYYRKGMRGRVFTSIDRNIQSFLEKNVSSYMANLKNIGINNVSAVILCSRTNSVLAAVGSQDYFEPSAGQIIGFDSRLSPGSLLKPFLYARAIETGLITPLTLLEDVPIYYSDYEPTNYGGIYTGISSSKSALCNSLNIPAIKLLEKVGTVNFFQLLKSLGFSIPDTHEKYGLSIILGSAEITLLEAVKAFTVFNNYGILHDLNFEFPPAESTGNRVFEPGTSFIISDMLTDHPGSSLDKHIPYKISWKTGTSFMYRDAWTVGYNPHFTVGVWTGNMKTGSPPVNTGHTSSAPLMFMIFDYLMKDKSLEWYKPPADIIEIEVCSLSGMIPSPHCPHTRKTMALSTNVAVEKCKYHKLLPVDKEGYALCSEDSSENCSYQVYVDFPPSVISWLRLNKNMSFKIPRYRPGCQANSLEPPAILFPQDNQVFELYDSSDIIPLKFSAPQNTKFLYLFVDDEYVQRYTGDMQINIIPEKGTRKIYLVDDSGRLSNSVSIRVK